MGKLFPKKFRDNVVRVARERGPGVTSEQVATDFGVHPDHVVEVAAPR